QFDALSGKAFIINALLQGEVSIELIEYLRNTKDALLVLDVQGFVRIRGAVSRLINTDWPEKKTVLVMVDILKADAIEAESLTGEKDHRKAAKILAGWGPKEIVLTYRNGILVYAEGEFYEAEFHPQELIGRTGRGDTCIASYVAKRLSTPPSEAILWSAAVTSLKMEAEGPFLRPIEVVEELIRRKYKQP
ncbi:ribokinase, partial [bacterium]|nr:ribokinase [bacterium]